MYAYQTAHPLWSLPWRANFTFTWWPEHPTLQRPSRWSRRDIPPEWRHTWKPPEFRRSRTRCWERCQPSTGTCSSEAWTLWMRVRTGCQDRFLSTLYVPLIFYLNTHWGDFNSSSNSCFLRDTTFAFSFMSCQTYYNTNINLHCFYLQYHRILTQSPCWSAPYRLFPRVCKFFSWGFCDPKSCFEWSENWIALGIDVTL